MVDSSTTQASVSVPIKVVNEFVKQLCMTFSAISLYSWQHPATKERISKGWDFLNKTLENHGDILLTVAGNRLLFHTEAVDEKNPGVRRLARQFDGAGVSSVSFARGMVADEYETFYRLFSMDNAEIEQQADDHVTTRPRPVTRDAKRQSVIGEGRKSQQDGIPGMHPAIEYVTGGQQGQVLPFPAPGQPVENKNDEEENQKIITGEDHTT